MIKLTVDEGLVYVNPDHIIYFNENEEGDDKWTEMYLVTEQILEVHESPEHVLELIKNVNTINKEA